VQLPESGPFTLLILSFTVFSFVAWQLRSRNALKLGFSAGVLMLAVAGRILLQQIVSIIQVVVQGSDPTIPVFDGLLVCRLPGASELDCDGCPDPGCYSRSGAPGLTVASPSVAPE